MNRKPAMTVRTSTTSEQPPRARSTTGALRGAVGVRGTGCAPEADEVARGDEPKAAGNAALPSGCEAMTSATVIRESRGVGDTPAGGGGRGRRWAESGLVCKALSRAAINSRLVW